MVISGARHQTLKNRIGEKMTLTAIATNASSKHHNLQTLMIFTKRNMLMLSLD